MTCEEIEACAETIREKCAAFRVRIVIETTDGNSLTVESVDTSAPPIGERVECFDQAPWAR